MLVEYNYLRTSNLNEPAGVEPGLVTIMLEKFQAKPSFHLASFFSELDPDTGKYKNGAIFDVIYEL